MSHRCAEDCLEEAMTRDDDPGRIASELAITGGWPLPREPRIRAEAFPGGRKGHIDGERCKCRPYRDHEVRSVLVHQKWRAA